MLPIWFRSSVGLPRPWWRRGLPDLHSFMGNELSQWWCYLTMIWLVSKLDFFPLIVWMNKNPQTIYSSIIFFIGVCMPSDPSFVLQDSESNFSIPFSRHQWSRTPRTDFHQNVMSSKFPRSENQNISGITTHGNWTALEFNLVWILATFEHGDLDVQEVHNLSWLSCPRRSSDISAATVIDWSVGASTWCFQLFLVFFVELNALAWVIAVQKSMYIIMKSFIYYLLLVL